MQIDDLAEMDNQQLREEFARTVDLAYNALNEGVLPNLEAMAPELRKKIVQHVAQKRREAERYLGVAEGLAVAARASRLISYEDYQTMHAAVVLMAKGATSVDA